jgi:AraC family transcriptional regulator of arabinose operon
MAINLNDSAVFQESGEVVEEVSTPASGVLIAGHFVKPHGYMTYRAKGTRDWLLTYTISGRGTYVLDGETITCFEGDIVLLAPGTMHHYFTPHDVTWEFYWVHFTPTSLWHDMMKLLEPHRGLEFLTVQPLSLRHRIIQSFQRLLLDSLLLGDVHYRLAMNAVEEILLLISQSEGLSKKPVRDPRIQEVLHLLHNHMKEPHSIDQLARHVSLSASRLAHLFKAEVGDSILHTLLKLRLHRATQLLELSERLISEIAEDVGFLDPFYFTKQFQAHYRMSPSQYRKKMTNTFDKG